MKRILQALVALFLLWLVVHNLDVDALIIALSRLRFWPVAAAIVLFFLAWCLATWKWRLLWRKASWLDMLEANFSSQFYSILLPGQIAGEVVKTYRLGRRFAETAGVAASVLVDRATGLAGLLLLAFLGVLLSTAAAPAAAVVVLSASAIAVICALYAITLPRVSDTAASAITRIGARYRPLRVVCGKIIELLSAWMSLMSSPRRILASVCVGIAFQALCVGINMIIAFELGIEVGFFEWSWIFGLVSLALYLPITIAGIGVREATYAGLLSLLGVPIEGAVAVSIVMFGISLLGVLVGGLLELSYSMRPQLRSRE